MLVSNGKSFSNFTTYYYKGLKMTKLDTLIFEGGGAKGVAYLGALKAIESKNPEILNADIKKVAGTSAGAITALLVATGYTASEAHDLIYPLNYDDLFEYPLSKITDVFEHFYKFKNWGTISDIINSVKNKYGVNSGVKFKNFLENTVLTKKGLKKDITFSELKKITGKSLYVFSLDVAPGKLIEFSPDNDDTKDSSVVDAVRASMSIPVFFQPAQVKTVELNANDFMVDGGLINNYPFNVSYGDYDSTMGFVFKADIGTDISKDKPNALEWVLLEAMDVYNGQISLIEADSKIMDRTVTIDTEDVTMMSFDMNDEQKKKIIKNASDSTTVWLNKNTSY